MVRSVLPLLAVQCVGASDLSNLMQRSGQGSRTEHLQKTAEDMEVFYRSMLEKAMQDPTAAPVNPDKGYLKEVENQFGLLEDELKTEKGLNQKLLTNTRQKVVDCNTARADGFAGPNGAVARKELMQGARDTHRTCRVDENGKIGTMENNCGQFNDAKACDSDQDWYKAINGPVSGVTGAEASFKRVVELAVVCKSDIAATKQKAGECDTNQGSFEKKFCAYASKLDTICTEYASCYSTALDSYNEVEEDVKDIETSQKLVWFILQRVRCYIDALETVTADSKPNEDMVNDCKNVDHNTDVLNITYVAPPAEDKCGSHPDVADEPIAEEPGSTGWEGQEYSEELFTSHDKLADISVCDSQGANGVTLLNTKKKSALVEVHAQSNYAKVGDWITCGHNTGDLLGEPGKTTLEQCTAAAADAGCTTFAFKDGSRSGLKDFGAKEAAPNWSCRCGTMPDAEEHNQMLTLAQMPKWNKRTPEAWPACKDGWQESKAGYSYWVQKK